LRVYETVTDPTAKEVCGYLLVRGSVHAHAYALAIKKITGVAIEKMLPTPNIPLERIPESQKYLKEGSHRRLYRFSPDDYKEMAGIWGNGEKAVRNPYCYVDGPRCSRPRIDLCTSRSTIVSLATVIPELHRRNCQAGSPGLCRQERPR
jgi:Mn-containing catalase